MVTWANLINGYNPYSEFFSSSPNLYDLASSAESIFYLSSQIFKNLPYDLYFMMQLSYTIIIPVVSLLAIVWVFFAPFIKAPYKW